MTFSIFSFEGARFVFEKQRLLYLQGRNFQAGQEDPPLQQLRSHAQIFNGQDGRHTSTITGQLNSSFRNDVASKTVL